MIRDLFKVLIKRPFLFSIFYDMTYLISHIFKLDSMVVFALVSSNPMAF
jgi:hypothetical protein